MKKLTLNLGRVKEVLTKEQMKLINGGYGTCLVNGWTAHNDDWTQYSEGYSSETDAINAMNYYGWTHYCNDRCHSSCCEAQPWYTGC